MKYQVLISLKNNEKMFMIVVCSVVIGTLRVKHLDPAFFVVYRFKSK